MKPKRVLHFQGRMGRGGAESFMMNAFKKIDKTKIVFDFVVYNDFKDVQPYHKEIKEMGGKIFVVPNPNKNILKYIIEVKKILRNNQVDIVHNQIFFGGGLNLFLAKKAGITKRIAHSHATTDGKGNKFPYNFLRPLFKKLLLDSSTELLACSQEAGIGLFGKDKEFKVIPNGIEIKKYSEVKEEKKDIKKSLNIPNDSLVIGHIGRFEEQKNHNFLIEIFTEVLNLQPNSYLILVGTGSLIKDIIMLTKELRISQNVLFLNERDDVHRVLKAMDVFVMPSLYEGLPMVAVEAQASNLKLLLSSEISQDTVLSENVQFLNLEDPAEIWANYILSKPFRNTPLPKLKKFDNNYTAEMLEKIYIN